MIPDPATLLRGMPGANSAPDGLAAVAPALQVAIMEAGKDSCTCTSCRALLKVQEALRATVLGTPQPSS